MKPIPITGRDLPLVAHDLGGEGPGALLLHGLAGTAGEWEDTASWLSATHRVLALDQRGHGGSERRPEDVSRKAFVTDALAAIEQLGLAPALVVGQSLGGQIAFLAAAVRPDLVSALVVAEASPAAADPGSPERIRRLLSAWPAAFASVEAARDFFGGDTPRARAWTRNLDGLRAPFDVDVMVRVIAAAGEACWDEWRRIEAPALVVRGRDGDLAEDDAAEMVRMLPRAEVVTLPGGHDVHLDAPFAWREAVSGWLAQLS